jgi:hypothetical protein
MSMMCDFASKYMLLDRLVSFGITLMPDMFKSCIKGFKFDL